MDADDYKTEMVCGMSEAWKLAQAQVRKAQSRQKTQHDQKCNSTFYQPGERVFLYMPAEKACKAHKFAKAFDGPYRVVDTFSNGVEVRPVDKPQADTIRVVLNRVRRCSDCVADEFWPTRQKAATMRKKSRKTVSRQDPPHELEVTSGAEQWRGRLRSSARRQQDEDVC